MFKDFYFSQSYYDYWMNKSNWIYEEDAYMPVIKIEGEYVPYSEQIDHGIKPLMRRDDLRLLVTMKEEDIDIIVVKRLDYI